MSIRQPAAEKLVRQLLELRLTRLTALSDEFIATMGKMVVAFVDMDEQRQRSEEIMEPSELAHTDHPMRHYDRTCLACNAAPHADQKEE